MLVRNSIGRSVSLLNDERLHHKRSESSSTTASIAESRSISLSTLPSISTFYQAASASPSSNTTPVSPTRKSQQQHSYYPSAFSRKGSYASTAVHSPLQSAADHSPTLSSCSTEVESSTLYPTTSKLIHSYSPIQQQNQLSKTGGNAISSAATTTQSSSLYQSSQHLPHRPAGPTPLLQKRPQESNYPFQTNSASSSMSSSYSGGALSGSNSSSSSISSTNTTTSSSNLSTNSLLSSHHSNSTSSSRSSLSLYSINNINNKDLKDTDNRHQSLPSPTSLLSFQQQQQQTRSRDDHLKHPSSMTMMDLNPSKSAATATAMYHHPMLSSPTTSIDPYLYGASAGGISMNGAIGHQRNSSLNGQYFSVAQQPLPPPVSNSSPIMYNTMDSPLSTSLMDPYLQQQIPSIPFPPYPNELIPGALTQQTNATQSVTATSPSDTSNNSAAPKMAKKKYPCPHAVKYNCPDTFTTSGHAARHGKKHTGEKNIHCPVCSKAFTRKDNMKQHERTHRNKGEASKVAEAVESNKQRAQSTLSKSSTNTSVEVEMPDSPPAKITGPQSTIQAAHQQRRPTISTVQQMPPSLTSPIAADIPMPVTLDSGETLQPVAPSLQVEPMDKTFGNIFDHSFTSRSQENILGRPSIFERTTSTGSGFSADGEGESPGLDALAMAAELG